MTNENLAAMIVAFMLLQIILSTFQVAVILHTIEKHAKPKTGGTH